MMMLNIPKRMTYLTGKKQLCEKLYDNVNEVDYDTPIENIILGNDTKLTEAETQKLRGNDIC